MSPYTYTIVLYNLLVLNDSQWYSPNHVLLLDNLLVLNDSQWYSPNHVLLLYNLLVLNDSQWYSPNHGLLLDNLLVRNDSQWYSPNHVLLLDNSLKLCLCRILKGQTLEVQIVNGWENSDKNLNIAKKQNMLGLYQNEGILSGISLIAFKLISQIF